MEFLSLRPAIFPQTVMWPFLLAVLDQPGLDYRKKSAVRTALENLIQEKSHADGKHEHFATLATL